MLIRVGSGLTGSSSGLLPMPRCLIASPCLLRVGRPVAPAFSHGDGPHSLQSVSLNFVRLPIDLVGTHLKISVMRNDAIVAAIASGTKLVTCQILSSPSILTYDD